MILDHALDNAYIGLFEFCLPVEVQGDYNTFFKSLELAPMRQALLPSGISYFDQIGIRGVAEVNQRRLQNKSAFPKINLVLAFNLKGRCRFLSLIR